jgi:hypothetical protein
MKLVMEPRTQKDRAGEWGSTRMELVMGPSAQKYRASDWRVQKDGTGDGAKNPEE